MILKDSLQDSNALEKAVPMVLEALGFEVTPIGGNGNPDGKAEAYLGYAAEGDNRNYSITYDAKSTKKNRIKAETSHISGLVRHREDYNATYSLEIAIGYEGYGKEDSAITKEANKHKVTMMTAEDLIKLLLLSTPKQVGLDKIRELFEKCYAPHVVHEWVESLERLEVQRPPYYAIIDIIYSINKTDTEPPTVEVVRNLLNRKLETKYSTSQVREWITTLSRMIPEHVSIDKYVGIKANPKVIKDRLRSSIAEYPIKWQGLYHELFPETVEGAELK